MTPAARRLPDEAVVRRARDPFAEAFRIEPSRPEPAAGDRPLRPERSTEGAPRGPRRSPVPPPPNRDPGDARRIRADLASRAGLRRALILQEILGPPKALRPPNQGLPGA